jgi:hypothetical protein
VQPNVLVVILDAARRDAFEPYGAPAGSSPAIAQLAARGAALPDVYATAPWTVPSHASIFTGLMPRAAGLSRVPSVAASKPAVAVHRDRMLPEVLRRAGYRTTAVSANLWVSAASGFDVGFEEFRQVTSGRHGRMHEIGRRAQARWLLEALRARVDDGAVAVERELAERLKPADRPFFCFVNLLECHSPYLPPRPYGGFAPLRRLLTAEDARRYFTLHGIWHACGGTLEVPEATLRRARHFYRAAIRYMDDWLARVLERLDRQGILDDTIVVIASDHGENFGEGGLITHGLSLDQRLVNVPFVTAGPGATDAPLNSFANLPRWIAERVGLAEHPWHDGPPDGFGVAQFDGPVAPGDAEAAEGLASMGLGHLLERFSESLTCAVAGGVKLVRRGDREEVYDLGADPAEERPQGPDGLAPAVREQVDVLRGVLDHPAVATSAGAAPAAPPADADEVKQLEDQMRMLGYM